MIATIVVRYSLLSKSQFDGLLLEWTGNRVDPGSQLQTGCQRLHCGEELSKTPEKQDPMSSHRYGMNQRSISAYLDEQEEAEGIAQTASTVLLFRQASWRLGCANSSRL